MAATEPIYKLIIDPGYRGTQQEHFEAKIENMNFALQKIGEAKGWGNNPRWDLLFDAGLRALLEGK